MTVPASVPTYCSLLIYGHTLPPWAIKYVAQRTFLDIRLYHHWLLGIQHPAAVVFPVEPVVLPSVRVQLVHQLLTLRYKRVLLRNVPGWASHFLWKQTVCTNHNPQTFTGIEDIFTCSRHMLSTGFGGWDLSLFTLVHALSHNLSLLRTIPNERRIGAFHADMDVLLRRSSS